MTPQYTPSQQRIFRAVAGAVKNAADGHRNWKIDKTMAHSIAKRATGTIVASWPDVLAAQAPSDGVGACGTTHGRPLRVSSNPRRAGRGAALLKAVQTAGRRSPLRLLHNAVGAMAGEAKHAGKPERAEALIDVLRLIASMQKEKAI